MNCATAHILLIIGVKKMAKQDEQRNQGEAVAIDVKKMVDRFLSWKLPKDFSPDCGISFEKHKYANHLFEPIGTNLFTADQAKEMFEYCIHYQRDFDLKPTAIRIRRLLKALNIPDPSNDNDNTLIGCLFSLLGMACRKLELAAPTTPPQSASVIEALEVAIDGHLKAYANVVDIEKDYREYGIGGGCYTSDAIADANKALIDSIEALVKIRALIQDMKEVKL